MEIDELKQAFAYCPEIDGSGLVWLKNAGKNKTAGKPAGSKNANGYWIVTLKKKAMLAHRVIMAMHLGFWPEHNIDHIDGNPSNNKLENLRLCPNGQKENMQNLRLKHVKKAGLLGVTVCKTTNKYRAKISVNNSTIHIGRFNTAEEAHIAYMAVKQKVHPWYSGE